MGKEWCAIDVSYCVRPVFCSLEVYHAIKAGEGCAVALVPVTI